MKSEQSEPRALVGTARMYDFSTVMKELSETDRKERGEGKTIIHRRAP